MPRFAFITSMSTKSVASHPGACAKPGTNPIQAPSTHAVVTWNGVALRALLVSVLVLAYFPLLLSPGDLDFLGAIAFVLLWLCVAYVAHGIGDARLLNLATAVIGVRILIVYFEVFGSLFGTGIGLVIGGVLTLALVWLWIRLRHRFAPEQREGER